MWLQGITWNGGGGGEWSKLVKMKRSHQQSTLLVWWWLVICVANWEEHLLSVGLKVMQIIE